ncbi:hypothetical protein CerSpe_060030 [Prunus speciosa]
MNQNYQEGRNPVLSSHQYPCQGPTFCCFGEPTNHLDMQADALDEFTGGVILVSHDSRLISRLCEDEEKSEIWGFEDGTVRAFPGTLDEYKEL